MDDREFGAKTQEFADTLSRLLNASICNGVRISSVVPRPGWAIVGRGVGQNNTKAQLIRLNRCAAPRVTLYLTLSYNLERDDAGQHLMVTSSVLGLSLSEERGKKELLHADYERNKSDGYPEAHLQVIADSEEWRALMAARGDDPLKKLHLPAGGRRYRTTLEDMIEFVIREGFVEGSPGWEAVIEQSRSEFAERQLRAAVRRHPEIARDELEKVQRRPD